jgi:NAD(P)-dependent dehydrogenase (short-subunit alcohol dehydrogenase family)
VARRALVTGASRGIGFAVAERLAAQGWAVTLIARSPDALQLACDSLPGEGHRTVAMDVADEAAWEALAPSLTDIEGLVCAASVLGPVGPIGTYTLTDVRRTLDINLLGTLLAIVSCLPALRSTSGRVVTFSGGGGTAPMPRFDAYAMSKAATVRLTENLALELQDGGIRVNCVAPGFVATDIHLDTLAAGPGLAGEAYFERTRRELEHGGVPAGESAELVCMLLESNPEATFTGRLISAQWDPWRDSDFWRRLGEQPDLGTLRRIDDMMFLAEGSRANER